MGDRNEFEGLELGDLVNFITKDYMDSLTEIEVKSSKTNYSIKQYKNNNLPPTMVVIELARLESHTNKLFDEKSGQRIRDEVQVKCMWYSRIKSKESIQERWFNSSVLRKIETENPESEEIFALNKATTLKTYLAAGIETEKIIRTQEQLSEEKRDDVIYKFETDTTSFFPPRMVVTALGKRNDENISYSERTGDKIKWSTDQEIKCMWYDASTGKFSEKFFPRESLMIIAEKANNSRLIELVEKYIDSTSSHENSQVEASGSNDDPALGNAE